MILVFMFTGCKKSNSAETPVELTELSIKGDWKVISVKGDTASAKFVNVLVKGLRFAGAQYIFSFDNGILVVRGYIPSIGMDVYSSEEFYTIQGNKLVTVNLDDTAKEREFEVAITDDKVARIWEEQIGDNAIITEYEVTITGDKMTMVDENGTFILKRMDSILDRIF